MTTKFFLPNLEFKIEKLIYNKNKPRTQGQASNGIQEHYTDRTVS